MPRPWPTRVKSGETVEVKNPTSKRSTSAITRSRSRRASGSVRCWRSARTRASRRPVGRAAKVWRLRGGPPPRNSTTSGKYDRAHRTRSARSRETSRLADEANQRRDGVRRVPEDEPAVAQGVRERARLVQGRDGPPPRPVFDSTWSRPPPCFAVEGVHGQERPEGVVDRGGRSCRPRGRSDRLRARPRPGAGGTGPPGCASTARTPGPSCGTRLRPGNRGPGRMLVEGEDP